MPIITKQNANSASYVTIASPPFRKGAGENNRRPCGRIYIIIPVLPKYVNFPVHRISSAPQKLHLLQLRNQIVYLRHTHLSIVGGIHGLFTIYSPKNCKRGLHLVTICNTITMVSGGGDAAHQNQNNLGGFHHEESTRTRTRCYDALHHGSG